MRRFESTDTIRWFAQVVNQDRALTSSILLRFVEIDSPTEPWFAGVGEDRDAFLGRLKVAFYQNFITEAEIDTCQNAVGASVCIYPELESRSFVTFHDACCYSYTVTPVEIELEWTFRGTTVAGLDWDWLQRETAIIGESPLEPIRWQESGF